MEYYPHTIIHKIQLKKTDKFSVLEKIQYNLYEVDINFDAAHDEWTKNKKKGKN